MVDKLKITLVFSKKGVFYEFLSFICGKIVKMERILG